MSAKHTAHFDSDATAVVIERLTIRDQEVVREARRWGTGERGPLTADLAALTDADLTNFITEAMRIGAHALSVTGQAQEAQAFAAAASGAKTAITEADTRNRRELTTAVKTAHQDLNTELRRIFTGDSPELVERLQPVLDKFGTDLDAKVRDGLAGLMANAAKQFDPADPASPMARHAADLTARQREFAERLDKQHAELTDQLEKMSTALRVREATSTLAKATPLKGTSYADAVHQVLTSIAAGLGEDYADTSAATGLLPRCKKGDGVMSLNDGAARVVIEMTDSARAGWADYFAEAERNRDAVASLGLVRTTEQNSGQILRVLGSQRLVLAFDPDYDTTDLLRTTLMLLKTTAIATVGRKGVPQTATAEEKITEALTRLMKIDKVKKASVAIQRSATTIETECTALNEAVRRLLDEALVALAGANAAGPEPVGSAGSQGVV
jgi:hypothetical protein